MITGFVCMCVGMGFSGFSEWKFINCSIFEMGGMRGLPLQLSAHLCCDLTKVSVDNFVVE